MIRAGWLFRLSPRRDAARRCSTLVIRLEVMHPALCFGLVPVMYGNNKILLSWSPTVHRSGVAPRRKQSTSKKKNYDSITTLADKLTKRSPCRRRAEFLKSRDGSGGTVPVPPVDQKVFYTRPFFADRMERNAETCSSHVCATPFRIDRSSSFLCPAEERTCGVYNVLVSSTWSFPYRR